MDCNGERIHVHFMGICGSGCASIAMLALKQGFLVSGCDTSVNSYYAEELKKSGIRIEEGHSARHLTNDVDIVAVSPAVFDISPDNEEVKEADRRGILMTWQEFMGKYLQKDKRVIGVSGTHGKTTTTFLLSELLLDAGLDPTVVGGSVYKKWGTGGRAGSSDLFLCEADEFNRNFFHYRPETAVVMCVEMDHPECFRDFSEVKDAFTYFLTKGNKLKNIVISGDDPGAVEVLSGASDDPEVKNAETYVFFADHEKELPVKPVKYHPAIYKVTGRTPGKSGFTLTVDGKTEAYTLQLPGDYNVMNASAAILTAMIYGVDPQTIRAALAAFSGAGRRFDLVGKMDDVPVFDDYAHHPTEIRSLLSMCRAYYPEEKILAIFEPHQVSRLRLMFDEYVSALNIADSVVIMKTHVGREIYKNVTPIRKKEWESASDKFIVEEDPEKIRKIASDRLQSGDCTMILVIGAANSYKLSRYLVQED